METAPSEAPRTHVDSSLEPAAAAARPGEKLPPEIQQDAAQLAQAEPPPAPPVRAPEEGRAAAAASAEDSDGTERGSVLSEFLADGPPQVEDDGEEAAGERRPVQMQPDQTEPPAGEAPPVETAADDAPVSGGTSLYVDTFGVVEEPGLVPTTGPAEGADTAVVDQFGEPLVLSSLAAGAAVQNVAVPAPAPVATSPEPETDPLTDRRLAAGEDLDGEPPAGDDDEDEGLTGTAGDDILVGTAAGETLSGEAGNDTLSGGAGDDTLSGGDGQDVFAFSAAGADGNDVVTDFTAGAGGDTLRLSDVTDTDGDGSDLADLDAAGGNTAVGTASSLDLTFAGGSSITLAGVDASGVATFSDLETSNITVDVA